MVFANYEEINKKRLGLELSQIMMTEKEKPIFLCVGSDRVVGDCLSPMVGEQIKNYAGEKALVIGTLSHPINYKNLDKTMALIKENYPKNPVVVIDSVLGKSDEVGFVKLNKGGLILGGEYHEGIRAGNYHIVGVVNATGVNSLTFLKSVRLKNIMQMSKFIADGIKYAFRYTLV